MTDLILSLAILVNSASILYQVRLLRHLSQRVDRLESQDNFTVLYGGLRQ